MTEYADDQRMGGPEQAATSGSTDSHTSGTRRSFLAGVGAAGIGATLAGCMTAPRTSSDGDLAGGFARIPPDDSRTEWGTAITIGDGEVRTFVTVDENTDDKMVGAEFTPGILNAEPLPTEHVLYSVPIPDHEDIPFNWLGLDWEPGGHYPGDKYAIPHYDFHFYFPTETVISQIPENGLPPEEVPDSELYTYPLAKDMVPPDYFRTNYTFPYMGEHLYNAGDPQYNGGAFGNTFVYGHFQGNLIFMEPMITVPYFEQLRAGEGNSEMGQLDGVDRTDRRELNSPERFHEAGEYPTEYTVKYHEDRDVFTVTEHSFQSFEQTRGEAAGYLRLDRGPERMEGSTPTESTSGGTTVTVAPDGRLVFDPASIEVTTGTEVTWQWDGSYHNVLPTSQPSGASWSGEPEIKNSGHTYSHTFEVPGTYEYVCEPHRSQGMTGTVTVTEG